MSHLRRLTKNNAICPPKYVIEGLKYLTLMGSVSYCVSNVGSDIDIYGFSIPNKEMVFPHLNGEIYGFGRQVNRFEQYQQHHVKEEGTEKEYDFSVYSIIKYFQLCTECNPNMIDSLFTSRRCVTYTTKIGEMVRENRKLFLHKGAWFKFKGYAFSQMHKMEIKKPEENSKRFESIKINGYDLKFAYHVCRLLLEIEQILIEHDLDLERNGELLKSIRRGEWKIEQIKDFFKNKESELENVYLKSDLRHSPDEQQIKNLLLNCLEEYYGSLKDCVIIKNKHELIIQDLKILIDKYS